MTELPEGQPKPELKNPDKRPYLSFSRLSSYGGCPRGFQLNYIEKAPLIPQGALVGGSAVHEAIELAESKELWASDQELDEARLFFMERFKEQVEEQGGPSVFRWGGRKGQGWPEGETYEWWMLHGAKLMLPNYARVRRSDAEAGILKVEHAEAEVLTELPGVKAKDGGPVFVKGYIDLQVLVTDDGELVVRDWKTGSGNAEPIQLASYCWQLHQAGSAPTVGEFVYLRRGPEHRVKRHDVAKLVPLVPELYGGLAGMLLQSAESGLYPMQPSSFCVACKVRLGCSYGKTLGPPPQGWADSELPSA